MYLDSENSLRTYLFSNSSYPHYGGKLDALLFGCESEFIIRETRTSVLMRRDQSETLYRLLCSDFGYRVFVPEDEHRVSKDTSKGYVTIKPDFAFHILEISFPPRPNPEQLSDLIRQVLWEVDSCLAKIGCERSSESAVAEAPFQFDMVPFERHDLFIKSISTTISKSSPYAFAEYPAMIAATQVHLNVLDDGFFSMLSAFYELEWISIGLFSKSTTFNGMRSACSRVLLLENSLGGDYPLKAIPTEVPADSESYWRILNSTPKFFPADATFAAKDYSFIRPRPFGSVEFRSSCTQHDVDSILGVCAFRVLQLIYAREYCKQTPLSPVLSRVAFLQRAMFGAPSVETNEFELKVLKRLEAALSKMPRAWRERLGISTDLERSA